MRIIDVVKHFSQGSTKGNANTVKIDGNKLYSYGAIIAVRTPVGIALNTHSYSMTTTRHQNTVRTFCKVVKEFDNEVDMMVYYHSLL